MSKYKLVNGECLKVMKRIKDNSIDLILCDLPFGTTACSWDSIIPFESLWESYNRIIKKEGAVVLFASQPFTAALLMSNPTGFKYEWIWRKNKASNFLLAKKMPLKSHENILVFGSTKSYNPQMSTGHKPGNRATRRIASNCYGKSEDSEYGGKTERYPKSMLDFNVIHNGSKNRVHPTQKPVPLLEYLIKTYTNKGDAVLDNCMGSGSTGVACMMTERRFVGIEMDKKYFKIARNRIESVPQKLF